MRVTMWVMFVIGVVEVGSNSLFLIHTALGKGIGLAKKFHGDFPSFASNRAWMIKIVASLLLGVVAIMAAVSIFQDFSIKMMLSGIFAGGMMLMCVMEAYIYGKKHLPALISIVLGGALVVLVLLRL